MPAPPTGNPSFDTVVGRGLADLLAHDPERATRSGEHRFDDRLADFSPGATEARRRQVAARVAELSRFDIATLTLQQDVDRQILCTALGAHTFVTDELREPEWNPLHHNPGPALDLLLARNFAPAAEQLTCLRARLLAVPQYLATARSVLRDMPRVHVETALTQLDGVLTLCRQTVPAAAQQDPGLRTTLVASAYVAAEAVTVHQEWLRDRQPGAPRLVRLGPERFAAALRWSLDSPLDPATLLATAEAELRFTTERITELAGRMAGVTRPDSSTVHGMLDELGRDVTDDAGILDHCRRAMTEATAFVRDRDLVTVPDDPIAVIELPEVDRGVAVAYCRPPGPLETAVLPTEFAVSPTPAGWSTDRIASFYREYNRHMLHDLAVHEAMPGHALQLAHARRCPSPARTLLRSGTFVEGWAVYAEALMAAEGYRSDVSARAAEAVRMQQLKMLLRSVINTILDIRFHTEDLDERAAMSLMIGAGFQEEAEAAGKWRRVQLGAGQLSTYYTGYLEVSAIAAELRRREPRMSTREVHDSMVRHGSPAPRHLRTLLGLDGQRPG